MMETSSSSNTEKAHGFTASATAKEAILGSASLGLAGGAGFIPMCRLSIPFLKFDGIIGSR